MGHQVPYLISNQNRMSQSTCKIAVITQGNIGFQALCSEKLMRLSSLQRFCRSVKFYIYYAKSTTYTIRFTSAVI